MPKNYPAKAVTEAVGRFATPFHIYEEEGIRQAARRQRSAFAWNASFRNYFAVKALPNPHILRILMEEGMGLDCSSLVELLLAEKVGARGADIMFTSNDTSGDEFRKARELQAIINLDDASHLPFLESEAGLPELLCMRYNPGNVIAGNQLIGQPEQAKFGMPKRDILETMAQAKRSGVTRFGLHTMMISNNLDDAGVAIASVTPLVELARELYEQQGIQLEFINFGGGIGIPYHPDEPEFDVAALGEGIRGLLAGHLPYETAVYMECGRYITGPYGQLVSRVRHMKKTYKNFIGLDAAMQDLMRPGMYGAYHHISLHDQPDAPETETYDVTGSLCENNDKFAIDRMLPVVQVGDYVVIHDTGAHGHSMGFNYNGKLRSAEILIAPDGSLRMIRRAETPEDYFATLI